MRALSEGPWMIGENYLHFQRWKPNFMAEVVEITSLAVCVRFSVLPVEYYNEGWLRRLGDQIKETIKIDNTTLATTRNRLPRVCIEIDLQKPLIAG